MPYNLRRIKHAEGSGAVRKRLWLRRAIVRLVARVAESDDGRAILARELERQNLLIPPKELAELSDAAVAYPELSRGSAAVQAALEQEPIFITGRFRSGSTLLWNLFRHIPGTTAYYEPFNERRWFDSASRGVRVDPTHRNVSEYWKEYDGLDELGPYFRESWKFEHLYMPHWAWNPAMRRYIEVLIERAAGRPVLQFNEVDFRLAWLRVQFPRAKILHIFRHPRDQWCSTIQGKVCTPSSTLCDFERLDGFYLLAWGRDLRRAFPFVSLESTAHPYELFYQLWKLSYLFGRHHADHSLAFEDLLSEPRRTLDAALASVEVAGYDLETLLGLIEPVSVGRWKDYAEEAWFAAIERRVDAALDEYSRGLRLQRSTARSRREPPQ